MSSPLQANIKKIQSLLGIGTRGLIGLSIGKKLIKIAEVKKSKDGQHIDLLRYATHPLGEGTIIEDEIRDEEDLLQAIQEAFKKGKFSIKNVVLGLGGPSVASKRLRLVKGSADEIEEQVYWESQQYIPFDLDNAHISYHILDNQQSEYDDVDVIVGAATKKLIQSMKTVVEKADLTVKVMDLKQLAIINIFELMFSEEVQNSNRSYLILNISGQKTDFLVYTNNSISFAKEIPYGGLTMTEEIQRQMGVTYAEAEDLKTKKDENGNLPEEILSIINNVLEDIFVRINETIDFYRNSISDDSFKVCYVTGGSVQIPGMVDRLKATLGMDIIPINPFDFIRYDNSQYSKDEIEQISFTCLPVLGLAIREKIND